MPDPNLSPLVAALLADRGLSAGDPGDPAGIPLEIDPRDEMLSFLLGVTEGDRDAWSFDPYAGDIVDGRLRGRGEYADPLCCTGRRC